MEKTNIDQTSNIDSGVLLTAGTESVDIMGEDKDGNTPLHNAVKSGDLEAVRQLLREKTVDVSSDNHEGKNALDIARERPNKNIINELVKKIIHDSLDALKIFKEEPDKIPSNEVLQAEIEIKLTEDKIKYCLESLEQLNAENSKVEKPCHKQAEIWIFFIKEFVSNSRDNDKIKDKMPECFKRKDGSENPTEEARLANVRELIESCEESIADDGKELSYEQLYAFIDCMEVFASEGFGIGKMKDTMKKHFSERYIGKDEDVKKVLSFLTINIDPFFTKLQNYVQDSYKRANVLVYFVEALALEASGDTNIKTKMKQHFSKCYTEQHRELISQTRRLLIEKRSPQSQDPARELGLEDIDKFTNGDAKSFFVELEEYLQYVQDVLKLNTFLKDVEQENLKERVNKFDHTGKLTREVLSNFIDFHPKLQDQTKEDFTDFMKNSFFTELRKYIQNGQCVKEIISSIKELKSDDTSFLEENVKASIKTAGMRLKLKQEELAKSIVKYGHEWQEKEDFRELVFRILQESEEFEPENNFVLNPSKVSEKKLGREINKDEDFLKKEFEKLIKIAYRPKEITPQIIFNFLVNFHRVSPERPFERLTILRNIFLHQFHKYGCAEFVAEISKLRHELFMYYYARQVHAKLRDIEGGERPETMNEYLREELKNLNKSFETDDEMKMDIQKLVDQYFKFLIFIDSKKKEDPSSPLSDLGRREIAEEFYKLGDGNEDHLVRQYSEDEKNEFKKIVTDHGVREGRFDKVWNLYQKNGSESIKEKHGDAIKKIINDLKTIKNDYKLSNREVISLYVQFVETRGFFGTGEDHGLSRNKKLLDDRTNIAEKLSKHNPDEYISSFIDGEEFYIRSREVVSNILNTFYNALHTYPIELIIEDIFDDEIFLEYMLVKFPKERICNYMIIRKLLKLDYTAPYIVRLITKAKSDKHIDLADLKELVEELSTRAHSLYIEHLNELLGIESKKLDLYEELYKTINGRSFNMESMRCKEPGHAKKFLDIFHSGNEDKTFAEGSFGSKRLQLLNDVVLELIRDFNYDRALEILESASILKYTKLISVKDGLNMAEVRNALGERIATDDKDTTKMMFSEALKVLKEIPSDTKFPQFLLALSGKAYNTQTLLEEYGSFLEGNCTIGYVLDPSLDARTTNEEIYDQIHESPKYQELIALFEEYRRSLCIKIIMRGMAHGIMKDGDDTRTRRDKYERALENDKEIYRREKKCSEQNNRTRLKCISDIAYAQSMVGTTSFEAGEYSIALTHYQDALLRNLRALGIQRKMDDSYAAIKRTMQRMIKCLRNITSANEELTKSSDHKEKAMLHYKEALLIYTRIYEFEEHKYITDSIVFITDELKTLESSTSYFEKVLNIYEKAPKDKETRQGEELLHTWRELKETIASIPDELRELKVSYGMEFDEHQYITDSINFITNRLRSLRSSTSCFEKAAEINEKAPKDEEPRQGEEFLHTLRESKETIASIPVKLRELKVSYGMEFNEHQYITDSINFITERLRSLESSRSYLKEVLNIYEEAFKGEKTRQDKEKTRQDKEYLHTLRDIIKRISSIPDELGELKVSYRVMAALLFENRDLKFALTTLNDLASVYGKLTRVSNSMVQGERLKHQEKVLDIYVTIYKCNEYKYILSSIVFITDRLQNSTIIDNAEEKSLRQALQIHKQALEIVKCEQNEIYEISSIELIGNKLDELKLSNVCKDQLLSRNKLLQHTLSSLRQIAVAKRELGDSKVSMGKRAPQDYEIAFGIFRVLYKFNEFRYISNSIMFMTDKLRSSKSSTEESQYFKKVLNIYEEAFKFKKSNKEGGNEYNLEDLIKSIVFINDKLSNISKNDRHPVLLPHDEELRHTTSVMKSIATTYERLSKHNGEHLKYIRKKSSLTSIERFHKGSPEK